MTQKEYFYSILNSSERNLVIQQTIDSILLDTQLPGSLTSFPNRQKAFTYKVNSRLIDIDNFIHQLKDCLNNYGKAFLPLNSRYHDYTLEGANTVIICSNGVVLNEVTIADKAYLISENKLEPGIEHFIQDKTPEIWGFYKRQIDIGRVGFNWFEITKISEPIIPPKDRIVISTRRSLDVSLNSQAPIIVCI